MQLQHVETDLWNSIIGLQALGDVDRSQDNIISNVFVSDCHLIRFSLWLLDYTLDFFPGGGFS